MRLAFSTLGCPNWPVEQIISSASAYGYEGVEIRGILEHVDLRHSPHFTGGGIVETRLMFEDAGQEIICLDSSASFADRSKRNASMDEARAYINIANALACPLVRVFGGNLTDGQSVESATLDVAECLAALAAEAGPAGVKIALETHDAFSKGAAVGHVLREVNHMSVGALWDLHHPYREGEGAADTLAFLGPYLQHTHVKDSRDGAYCLLGEGDVPIREMLNLLNQSNRPNLWISLEWEKRWHPEIADPEIALPQYAKVLRQYLGVND